MQVIKINCEWDIGINECLWVHESAARADVTAALTDCGIDDPIEELEDTGLVSFESVEVCTHEY